MNKLISLFSSSSGNCTLVCSDNTNLLIDAGVSASRIKSALAQINMDICEIDGILVTHEHSDHIKGIGILSRQYNIPVYANEKTMTATLQYTGDLHDRNIRIIDNTSCFEIRDTVIKAFSIPHDAADPYGYTIKTDTGVMSIATDTGQITKAMLNNMCKSDCVLIEANHDVQMLRDGNYPYPLKKRILSENGHLSNENAAWLATQLAMWGTKKILLGHLSDHNNTEAKAYTAAKNMLEENNIKVGSDVLLKVAQKNIICQI